MNVRNNRLFAWVIGIALSATVQLRAADEKPTVISIPDMHCAGCAKKVTDKLRTVATVAKAEADMTAKTIKVTAKSDKSLSPKELWETVEKAEQKPTKLDGPKGVFTSKPKE